MLQKTGSQYWPYLYLEICFIDHGSINMPTMTTHYLLWLLSPTLYIVLNFERFACKASDSVHYKSFIPNDHFLVTLTWLAPLNNRKQ